MDEPRDELDAMEAVGGEGDELAAMRSERDGLIDDLQRMQADFSNYKKRIAREQAALNVQAGEQLVIMLLPVLDDFDLALSTLELGDNVRRGLELLYADLFGALSQAGLSPIVADGAPFDPNEHHAVAHEHGCGETTVVEVLRAGYSLNGRVLRPSMVKVAGTT